MFFTQEDYRKIEKWLLANSRKDTDFAGAATPLKGNETVVLVQNGKNVKASVKDVVEQLFLLGVSDFVNITDKYGESYISLSQAIELIPYRSRKIGQVVTFLDDTGKWAMFQFQGTRKNQWGTLSLWVDLIDLMTGLTITDSEDIVTETNSANQVALKFADKVYSTTDYSGLGRVYLRKNIVDVEDPVTGNIVKMNYLTQSMISKENTTYIVQYSYNLNKQTISIPEGSILVFEGGDINNGTITGNNTIVLPYGYKIQNVTLEGTFKYENGVNAISSDDICFNNEYDILDGRNLALKEIIGYNLQDDDYTILPQFDTIRNVNSVDGSFTGFPTSVIHNNLLYCFYYKAATHESTPGVQENIYYRYSSDKGVNWSDEKEWVLPASDVSGRFRSYRTAYAIPFGNNILFAIFCTTSTTSTLTGSFTLLCEASIDESNNITIVNQIKVPLIGTGGNLIYNYTDSTITNSMIVGGNIIKVGTNYLIACYTSDRDNYIFSFDGTFTDNTHLTILDSMISTEFDYTEHTFIKFSDTNFYIALREDKRRENTPIFKYNSSTSKFELFSYIDNVAYDGLDAILLNDSVAIIAGRDWRNYYTPTRFALINSSGSVFLSNAKYYGDVLGRDCGYCSLQIIDNTLVNIFYLKRSQPNYNYGIVSRRIPVDVVLNLIFY